MPVADRIDLTNIEGSMTNIIHNNADRLYTAQTVRELYDTLLSIFRENNLDTNASRRLLTRVIEQRNIKQGLNAIFNSYFKGANMGRDKEKVGGKPKMFKIDEKLKKIVSEEIEKIEVTTDDSEITVETEGEAVKVEIEPKCQGTECAEVDNVESELDYAFFSDLNPEFDIDDEVPVEDSESIENEEVVDEGFLGIKTKKEKEKEAKAKAEKEAQKQRDKELKDQEERARQQSTADSWARYDKAQRDAQADYNRSRSSQSSKVSNTDKAGVYYSGGDYYSEDLDSSKSIKESAQGTYSMRMYDYIDEYLDNEGRKDLCYAFTKWLSDDEVHEFAKANDLVPVFEDEYDLYESIEKKYVKPLKDKINACYTKQDLDEIGTYLDDFSDKDIDRILNGKVSNKDLNKMFGGYNFVDDDFPGWDFKESKSIKEELSYDDIQQMDTKDRHALWMKHHNTDFKNDDEFWDWAESEFPMEFIDESKSIKGALSVAEFIDWHETTNYKDNENTFEAVYSILDKYPESEDDVKAQYATASDEDKEAISRIIDKANKTATEEPTVYLARAMHKMYVDGYNYQEIADTLGAPVSLVIKMIGPDSYDESLTESTEKQYVAIDTQDKDNKDNNRKYTEKQLIDFAKELIKIEEESSEPDQYKKRPELKDDLASAKKVLKYFMYDVKEASEDKLTESFNLSDYRNMENAEYEKDADSEIVRTYTVYLPTTKGKDQIDICITRDFEADIDESDDGAWYIGVDVVGTNIDWRKLEDYLKTNYSSNIYATKYYWSDIIQDAEVIVQALVEIDQDDINQFLK